MIKQNKHWIQYSGAGVLLLLFLLLIPAIPVQPLRAQLTIPDTYKDLDEKIRTFFESIISSGNTSNAFENLLLQSPLGSSSAVSDVRTKLDEIKKQVGEFQAYEFYQVKPIGKDIVQIRYILKGEYYPVIWLFTFYRKPSLQGSTGNQPGTWQLVEIRFDSNLDI